MNKKQKIIRGHLTCTCDEAYKSRNMTDPNCFLCEYESEIELMMDEYVEHQLENCGLQNVNQQRELLLAFAKHIEKAGYNGSCLTYKQELDEFLKSNNCA